MTPITQVLSNGFAPPAKEGSTDAVTTPDPLPHANAEQIAIGTDEPVLKPEMLQSEDGRAVMHAFVSDVLKRVQTQAVPWSWTIPEFTRFSGWPELRVWRLIAEGLPAHKIRRGAPGQREAVITAFEFFGWILSQPKSTARKFQRRDQKQTELQLILDELRAGNPTQPGRRMTARKSV